MYKGDGFWKFRLSHRPNEWIRVIFFKRWGTGMVPGMYRLERQ